MSFEVHSYAADAVWFVPRFGGNRDKPAEQQYAVKISPMSAREFRRWQEGHTRATAAEAAEAADRSFVELWNSQAEAVLKTRIVELSNVFHTRHVGAESIREEMGDPVWFVDNAPDELLREIMEAIRDGSKISDGVLGKPGRPLGSNLGTTNPKTGDAPNAGEKDSRTRTGLGSSGVATERSETISRSPSIQN